MELPVHPEGWRRSAPQRSEPRSAILVAVGWSQDPLLISRLFPAVSLAQQPYKVVVEPERIPARFVSSGRTDIYVVNVTGSVTAFQPEIRAQASGPRANRGGGSW